MIKTYMIACSNIIDFQKRINEFIRDKNVIDIKFQSVLVTGDIHDRALIIYKED